MKKEEALQHFKENYVKEKSIQKMLLLEEYFHKHKEELALDFIKSFKNICIKIREMQLTKEKEKIAYITYSMLRTEILEKNFVHIIEAFNSFWFFDQKECEVKYDASWAFKFLDHLWTELEEQRKVYMNLITSSDIEKIILKEAEKYNQYIIALGRYALEKAAALKEFQDIEKEQELEVRIGEYMDVSEIVYKEDLREKASEEIKAWLEEKLPYKYVNEILRNLDLSKGNYEGIDLRYAELHGSNFSNSSMKNCILIGTKFNGCFLNNVDFSQSFINAADFTNCKLNNAIFKEVQAYSGLGNESTWEIPGYMAVNFQGADLEGADFQNAILKGAIFKGANLKGANFKGAYLQDAVFLKEDLDKLPLEEEQIKLIVLENS
ncbi:pentapeptide repeat-containing protein [Clostridium sp. DJ247]|uniref:pentapeptide repeat-containing protein n=1 Tax=Clostridium sp. DJ247 TaxID=2726188 RepID=UPI00162A20B9|nr:pentapeptide repeat-containing protein [Clostridium sp. DJ247]MBC2580554.1 pentapeptide repeat-containing protein [Clostridium sp. DJ247]